MRSLDGVDAVVVDLVDLVGTHLSHRSASRRGTRDPSAGRTASPSRARLVAVEGLERRAARAPRAETEPARAIAAAREAEQPLLARLAQVGDRVVVDVRVADPAPRERRARAAQVRAGARYAVEERGVPVPGRSHGIVRRASSPHAPSSPSSSPAKTIGTPGVVICRPTPTRCRSREPPTTVRKRAVSWLSSSVHEWSTDAPRDAGAEARASWRRPRRPARRGSATGRLQVTAPQLAVGEPRSHDQTGREEARVVHRRRASRRRAGRGGSRGTCSATSSVLGRGDAARIARATSRLRSTPR